MNLDVDTSLGVFKAALLEVAWVLTDTFAPSEFAKTVPPSEILLVCWGYSDPENFHSESVAAVAARVIFLSMVEMYVGNLIYRMFCCIIIQQERNLLWGVLHHLKLCLQWPDVNNRMWLFLGKQMPLGYIGVYQ